MNIVLQFDAACVLCNRCQLREGLSKKKKKTNTKMMCTVLQCLICIERIRATGIDVGEFKFKYTYNNNMTYNFGEYPNWFPFVFPSSSCNFYF